MRKSDRIRPVVFENSAASAQGAIPAEVSPSPNHPTVDVKTAPAGGFTAPASSQIHPVPQPEHRLTRDDMYQIIHNRNRKGFLNQKKFDYNDLCCILSEAAYEVLNLSKTLKIINHSLLTIAIDSKNETMSDIASAIDGIELSFIRLAEGMEYPENFDEDLRNAFNRCKDEASKEADRLQRQNEDEDAATRKAQGQDKPDASAPVAPDAAEVPPTDPMKDELES